MPDVGVELRSVVEGGLAWGGLCLGEEEAGLFLLRVVGLLCLSPTERQAKVVALLQRQSSPPNHQCPLGCTAAEHFGNGGELERA